MATELDRQYDQILDNLRHGGPLASKIGQFNLLAEMHVISGFYDVQTGEDAIAPDLTESQRATAARIGHDQAYQENVKRFLDIAVTDFI
jgi:hypothetical protein